MKKKLRKFSEGGFNTKMGRNEGASIDDDVRSRAMKFVEDASEESRDIGAPVTRSAAKSTSKVSQTVAPAKSPEMPAKAPPMSAEEKARIEGIQKKQELIPVRPEEMIGGGGVKALQVAGTKLASKIAADRTARAAKEAAETATKKAVRRSEEGFDPKDALAAREKVKTDELIKKSQKQTRVPKNVSKAEQKAREERYLSTGPMEGGFGTGSQFKREFKSGGSVKSSASRRADGCAIRGKTRA